MKQITNVAPVPPMATTKSCSGLVRTAVACSPAWYMAMLSSRLEMRAAEIAGSMMEGPWTPTNQKRDMAP